MVEWLVEYGQITNFEYQCWEAMVCYQKFGPLLFHSYDIFSSKISIFQNLEIFLGDFKSVVFARYFPTTWTFMFIFEVKSGSGSKSFEIWQKKFGFFRFGVTLLSCVEGEDRNAKSILRIFSFPFGDLYSYFDYKKGGELI